MSLGGTCPVFEQTAVEGSADSDGSIVDLTTIATPPVSESRVAEARAAHPSTSGPASPPDEGRLAVVKPIRPSAGPEAWSAGLWGSFA